MTAVGSTLAGFAETLGSFYLKKEEIGHSQTLSNNELEVSRNSLRLAELNANSIDDYRRMATGENSDGSTLVNTSSQFVSGISNSALLLAGLVVLVGGFALSRAD